MGGDEIDSARGRLAVLKQIGRAGEPRRQFADHARIAAPEFARRVAELVVPLAPAGGKAPDLIAARADVPRLGDQLEVAQQRVLRDGREQGRVRVEAFRAAAERGGEVEAEAVNSAVKRPGAQGVHRKAQRRGMIEPQNIAAAGVVDIAGAVGGIEAVGDRVVEPAQAERRAVLVALAGMVEHHVDQHFEAGRLQARRRSRALRASRRARGAARAPSARPDYSPSNWSAPPHADGARRSRRRRASAPAW